MAKNVFVPPETQATLNEDDADSEGHDSMGEDQDFYDDCGENPMELYAIYLNDK
jgi:hypothetical protein